VAASVPFLLSPRVAVAPGLVVTGAGPGGGPHVRGFETAAGTERFGFFAYAPTFTGGVHVAAGDVTGDTIPDVVTGAGPGGGPHVKVFDGRSLLAGAGSVEVRSFFAYGAGFTGGVRVAAPDVNRDGHADLVTAPGPGGGPHVRLFDGATGVPLPGPLGSFFPYPVPFTGGVFVGATP
jgi:hypothetical protein